MFWRETRDGPAPSYARKSNEWLRLKLEIMIFRVNFITSNSLYRVFLCTFRLLVKNTLLDMFAEQEFSTYKIKNIIWWQSRCAPTPVHQQLGHDEQDADQHGQPYNDEGPPEDWEAIRLGFNHLWHLSFGRFRPTLPESVGNCFGLFEFLFWHFIRYMATLSILKLELSVKCILGSGFRDHDRLSLRKSWIEVRSAKDYLNTN